MFERQFDVFVQEQRRLANGPRLEMLRKDLSGERRLFCSVLKPVLDTVKDLEMEHAMVSLSGVRIYGDFFLRSLRMIIEADGFAVHAENITRERFSFERMRIRTFAVYGYRYVPFSWDGLDKKPDLCRRTMYELIGRYSTNAGEEFMALSVYVREVLRCALRMYRPFRLADVRHYLQLGEEASRIVIRNLLDKQLVKALGSGTQRHHEFELSEKGIRLCLEM